MSLSVFVAGCLAGGFAVAALGHRSARKEAAILAHLADHSPCTGLDLVKAGCGARGTIYVRLLRMEERGLLRSVRDPDGGRHYWITQAGNAALLVEVAREIARTVA